MFVKDINDLLIYKLALQYSSEIVELVKAIPHHRNIPEVKQIIRSSASVPSNIREGFGQRFYIRKFLYYLNIAIGSSDETQNHLEKLKVDKYLSRKIADQYINFYKNLSIKILNFINYLKKKHGINLK